MRCWVSACLLVISACLAPIDAFATTYYVRVSGADANTGLAPAAAFKSLDKASTVVVSGDTVYVGAGTYVDSTVLDGVQQSAASVTFIADTTGAATGDAGPVIITNKMIGVVNCNYVEFHGFQFKDATMRFVVWKGSFDGLFNNCTFDGGLAPLLIESGSVRFENCQFTDFDAEAFYVDGEASLTMVNCGISDCQGDGIRIAKTARVVLDTTTIEDNLGDGIKVEHTTTTIDDGITGGGGTTPGPRLAAGKYRIVASGGMFDGYNSDLGPYGPTNSSAGADLYGNSLVSTAASVPVNGNVFYAPGGTASAPNITGSISQLSAPIAMAPVNVGDAATNNNNASIPLTNLGMNPLVGGTLIVPAGHTLVLPAGKYYFINMFINGGTLQLSGPTTVFVVGQVNVGGGTVVNPTQKPGDFKLSVLGPTVGFSGTAAFYGAIYAPNGRISLSGTVQLYGMAVANEIVMSGGGIHVDTSLSEYAATVQGIASGASTPAPPPDWTPIASGDLDISSSTISNNLRGVHLETSQVLAARFTQFSNNAEWGLYIKGTFKLEDCTLAGNGTGGMWVNGVNDGEFAFLGLTLTNNSSHAIYLENCDITFDGTWLDPSLITGSDHVLATSGGKLTIDGLTISGGAVAGVLATGGELFVSNSTFSGNGYGVAADGASDFLMDNCTVSNNSVGLYLHENETAKVVNSTIVNNSTWGASVYASGVAGAVVGFESCDVSSNAGGLAVMNASDGDFVLVDTDIHDNSQAGLHFEDCSLTLADQAANNWQVMRNQYNIRSLRSTLTLTGVAVSDSNSYGVFCEDSNVTLDGCTVQGRYGVYADAANDAITLTASRIEAGVFSGWGVVRYGGEVTITNSVFHDFWGGIYLNAPAGSAQARILNATVGNARGYGIYVAQGDATVQNTILTGDGSGYGLSEVGSATLAHSYNMLHDFSTPFYSTSPHATEILKLPRFVDATAGDYHLAVGSPAINVGVDLGSQVPTDMDGNARPSFNAYEMGAYEYVNPNGSFRVLEWNETR